MNNIAIRVENLSKRYRIGRAQQRHDTLRDALVDTFKRFDVRTFKRSNVPTFERTDEIWALRDVSFEVQRGEVVGIIGRNGAGKSTLLKILSRITEPTAGRAEIHGRVGSLLEVGTGFHPELSGRENIYLNGAILGMRRREIERRFDEIVAFAEIERFLDTPVKRYSSGMYVRLAFAVAAHLDPEILLVDEVLAVGDAAFQKKCLGKMGDVAKEGRTVLFVSHNMGAIQSLCVRAITLEDGLIRYAGPANEAINAYLTSLQSNVGLHFSERGDHDPPRLAWYTGVLFRSGSGQTITATVSGQPLDIVLTYRARRPGLRLDFAVGVYNVLGQKILHLGTAFSAQGASDLPVDGEVVCRFPKLPLPAGRYIINLSLRHMGERIDHVVGAAWLDVQPGDFYNTGKIPPATETTILADHVWLLPQNGRATRD